MTLYAGCNPQVRFFPRHFYLGYNPQCSFAGCNPQVTFFPRHFYPGYNPHDVLFWRLLRWLHSTSHIFPSYRLFCWLQSTSHSLPLTFMLVTFHKSQTIPFLFQSWPFSAKLRLWTENLAGYNPLYTISNFDWLTAYNFGTQYGGGQSGNSLSTLFWLNG